MWLTRVSIKNPYFATVLMLALLIVGLITANRISVEEFPDIKFPYVVITTTYSGASPEVIETDISRPIEEALNTLNGIKEIRSYSMDGLSTVVAEFNLNINPDIAAQDVRDKVAVVGATLRKGIDTPVVSRVSNQDKPIVKIAVSSNDMSLRDITTWVNQVAKKRLQTVPGVGDVAIVGGVDRQVRININPYKLQALGLSVIEVVNAIKNANNDYPAGFVKAEKQNINVRLSGKLQSPADFANLVIIVRKNVPIRISDVAIVEDGQDEYKSLSLLNDKRSIGLDIRQADKTNLVDVSNGVFAMIKELNLIKPASIKILVTYDQSKSIKRSLNNVKENMIEGALLTVLIVFLFLKSWRSTVITGLTLPISLIGTIFAIYICGFTLNMMSLLALSLSVGLLIDDSIVVRENIVRHLHMGKNHYNAALDGTNEIGLAVLATTMTVVAVFLPVGFMQGIIGKFFYQFGITVAVAVLISLLVSFTLDPMLSSIWHEPKDGGFIAKTFIGKILNNFENAFNKLVIFYEKLIRLSLDYKKTTLGIAFCIFIGSCFLVPSIGGEFIPKQDKGKYEVRFKTALGSNIDYTATKVNQLDKLLVNNIPEIINITAGVANGFGDTSNNASLTVDIGEKRLRSRSLDRIIEQSRELANSIGGIEVISVIPIGGAGGSNKPIQVEIRGDNLDKLKNIAEELITKIAKIKGVTDLENSFQQANPAFTVNINRDIASDLGVNLSDVGATLSTLFASNKVSTWEDPKNGQNYDVVLQIPQEARNSNILDLLKVPSKNTDMNNIAQMIPLSSISIIKAGFSPSELDHINLKRNITILGDIIGSDNQTVFTKIQKILNSYNFPKGYFVEQSGKNQDMQESFMYAVFALMIGVIFIYMILTAQFRSFIQPIIIMISLPLSFVGVFLALILTGSTLNMFSIIGIIMLMGLATKNGILLVDFINRKVIEGMTVTNAIIEAGKIRLRPIVMTSAAMVFGMLPLALSFGEGSEVRKPMAYAIIGGMVTSTLLTLIIIPVIYVYLNRFDQFIKRKLTPKD